MRFQTNLKEHLSKTDLFQSLTDRQFTELLSVIGRRGLAKNEVLVWAQDPGDALYIVLTGVVEVYSVSPDGREQILAILGPGELLGEMSIIDREPRSATAQALEQTEVAFLERTAFEQVLRSHPDLAIEMLKALSRRLRDTNLRLEEFAFQGVQPRIAKLLLDLAKGHGEPWPKGVKLGVKLTHQQLANFTGTSRETVTRTLLAFQAQGLIGFSRRYLVIYDKHALSELAGRGQI